MHVCAVGWCAPVDGLFSATCLVGFVPVWVSSQMAGVFCMQQGLVWCSVTASVVTIMVA